MDTNDVSLLQHGEYFFFVCAQNWCNLVQHVGLIWKSVFNYQIVKVMSKLSFPH